MNFPSNILRETKRLFGRLRHSRCKLPVLTHILVTADHQGTRLAVTDLDHWLETRISGQPADPECFLIPAEAMEAACRADRGSVVAFNPSGGRRSRDLGLVVQSGGIEATSVFPTLDPKEFPARPALDGSDTVVPPATLQSLATVATCASSDTTRLILNGVLFTPADGGQLVATDGRRLACTPAVVPPQPFVVPNLAVSVLTHPDFGSDLATLTWLGSPLESPGSEIQRVAFRSGRHLLVATTLTGNYPDYRIVIPQSAKELAVIPHDRKPGVIAWLRGLGKDQASVRLDWRKRGQLTLTHRDANGHSATMQVPVEIHGHPPVIAFNPRYLADALEIGSTLCFGDELSPCICRHPGGRFCVIMPMRVTFGADNPAGEVAEAAEVAGSAEQAAQAAA
jgi:DNA polymerase III sliding clamp (beta) subunit (PCNA family)